MRTTIRSAYQQGTQTTPAPAPANTRCPHCGVDPKELAVDAAIERAKAMAPKPYKRPALEIDRPEAAPAVSTAVRSRLPAGARRSRISSPDGDPQLQSDLDTANRNLKKRY